MIANQDPPEAFVPSSDGAKQARLTRGHVVPASEELTLNACPRCKAWVNVPVSFQDVGISVHSVEVDLADVWAHHCPLPAGDSGPWLVLRADVHSDLAPDGLAEVLAWLRSLGVNPDDMRPTLLITETSGRYALHLSQVQRDTAGSKVIDHAAGHVATTPVVIDLGTEATWPACLNTPADKTEDDA